MNCETMETDEETLVKQGTASAIKRSEQWSRQAEKESREEGGGRDVGEMQVESKPPRAPLIPL